MSNKKTEPAIAPVEQKNLLVDGSFESAGIGAGKWTTYDNVSGWKSNKGVEIWGKDFIVSASDGDKVMELDANKDGVANQVWQDVQTDKGAEYTFNFDYAMRPGTAAASNTILVYWNGELVGKVEPGSTKWTTAEIQVKGTGGLDRIEFREDGGDNDSYGGVIDNASLTKTAEAPVPVQEPVRMIEIKAEDISQVATGEQIVGSGDSDGMNGGAGDDHIKGLKGDDKINGDDVGTFTSPLNISAAISDQKTADEVRVIVAGMPENAKLSAGVRNEDGTWTLSGAELEGLMISAPDAGAFSLKITAVAADGTNLMATTEIKVSLVGGTNDVIEGGQGNDAINGQAGDDVIYGGSKPTEAVKPPSAPKPGQDNDWIDAGDGNDIVYGNSGDDTIFAGTGKDWVSGGKGNDLIAGQDGDDAIFGNSGDDMVWGDAGNDEIVGGSGNDTIWGGDGDDVVKGGSGDDLFYTDGGTDAIYGGSGFDTLVFSSAPGDNNTYFVDLSKGFVGNDEVGYDTLSSIEAVIGGYGNDHMTGSTKANLLVGGAGDDVLRGGAGADTLTGGDGKDTFVFLGKDVAKLGGGSLGMDLITDFEVGDVVDLTDLTSTRKAAYSLKDDGQSTILLAEIKGQMVEVVKFEDFTGHSLDDMINAGMLLV